jgi:hypothetical protein
MNKLSLLWSTVVFFAKALSYQWLLNLINLFKLVWQRLKDHWKSFDLPHTAEDGPRPDCTVVHTPSFHKPDPCIYSQEYLMSLGMAVTWDNPDIVIRKNGVIVPENNLLPDTDYEIDATIWNNSYDAPAAGLKVVFSYLSFGVGTVSTAIGATFVDLGVKSGANHPAIAQMPWRTPPVPGHFCLQVLLIWIDDANPRNNLGQNNLDVVAPQSPAEFSFQLRNTTGEEARFRFEVDTYSIPQPPECQPKIQDKDRGLLSARLPAIRARHSKKDYPIPAGWAVDLSPSEPLLAPDQEIAVTATVTPPDGFTGRVPFNVDVFADTKLMGGVTLFVEKA